MLLTRITALLLTCIILDCSAFSKNVIEDLIYTEIPDTSLSHCVRLLNATHEIGCSSNLQGNVGVVVYAENASQVNEFLDITKMEDGPYILAVSSSIFTNAQLMALVREEKSLVGLVVLDSMGSTINSSSTEDSGEVMSSSFSEDSVCPNSLYSAWDVSRQCAVTWNPSGTEYARISWPFPVVLVSGDQRQIVKQCYRRHNSGKKEEGGKLLASSGPRCAMQIMSAMRALGNAKICIRRNFLMGPSLIRIDGLLFCDDYNADNSLIWLQANQTDLGNSSVLLVVARVDVHSMFPLASFGAKSVVPAVSILSAVAIRMLREQYAEAKTSGNREVVFAFLDGESLDYLGSTWLAYTLTSSEGLLLKKVSLRAEQISAVLELGALGSAVAAGPGALYFHTLQGDIGSNQMVSDLSLFASQTTKFNVTRVTADVLPPSSNQALRRRGLRVPTVLITDFQDSYKNLYTDSFLDRKLWKNSTFSHQDQLLTSLSEMIYRFVYNTTFGPKKWANISGEDWTINPDELAYCFVYNSSCDFFERTFGDRVLKSLSARPGPIPAYSNRNSVMSVGKLTNHLNVLYGSIVLQNITERQECVIASQQDSLYDFYWDMVNGTLRCLKTLQRQNINGLNPYNYHGNFNWTGLRDAVWVESIQQGELFIRIFMLPTASWEMTCLTVGVVLTLSSIVVVLLFKRKTHLFLYGFSGAPLNGS